MRRLISESLSYDAFQRTISTLHITYAKPNAI